MAEILPIQLSQNVPKSISINIEIAILMQSFIVIRLDTVAWKDAVFFVAKFRVYRNQ
jgi:hypothetical protein